MTGLGHLQTFAATPPNVAFRAGTGRRMSAFAGRLNSLGGIHAKLMQEVGSPEERKLKAVT